MDSKAAVLHQKVPPDWYQRGIKENLGQRYWHHRRFSEVGKLIEPTGGKILDIGSADGTFTKIVLDRAKADLVVGVDILPSSVAYAQKRFIKNKKLQFKIADAEHLPFPDNEFDAVFALEILEHVFDYRKVLAEIKRVSQKDAYMIFLVPTENLLFKIIWFFWENTKGRIWKGTHLNKFNHQKLNKIITSMDFTILIEKIFLLSMLKIIKVSKK